MPVQLPRLAKIMGTPPEHADAASIDALIGSRTPEDTDLEYKRENTYIKGGDNAEELSKDVSGMANARGGLILIGAEEDDQAAPVRATPVSISDDITRQMINILRTRVVPWIDGTDIRPVPLPDDPGHGFYLIAIPRSPLAPHAVRTGGSSKPRFAYACRSGPLTRWLEETEIADAYRNRFRLYEEHTAQARRLLEENPAPPQDWIGADAVWVELALIPSAPACGRAADMAFTDAVTAFLTTLRATSPAPGLCLSQPPAIARRRVRIDSGPDYLDLRTDGSAFIRAHAAWRPNMMNGLPVPMHAVFLEYQVLGSLHLAANYALWAGAYGDADILARTSGLPTVFFETGQQGNGTTGQNTVTRTSAIPAQVTIPLDTISNDPRQLLLAARSIAADLLNDYGEPRTRLLQPDGTINFGLLQSPESTALQSWHRRTYVPS